ncbi:MAG: hypothetical protein EXR21_07930 [Flavobacteriaceae bacterium]|nr:hypothetical protein [Flavobacteriaceae bacterium]
MSNKGLLKGLLGNYRTSGAIAFSGKALVNCMVNKVDFDKAKVIVEFGPGNGCITRELLKRMRPDAVLYTFEVNKFFCDELNIWNDKRMTVVNDVAQSAAAHLDGLQPDYIVSALPFGIFSESLCQEIMESIQQLSLPKTRFVQFSYSPVQRNRYSKVFKHIKMDFTLMNIPPAFVFSCHN